MMLRPSLDLAVIGNGNIAALIDRSGALVWMCWPRLDGDPVFCALIDGEMPADGYFSIEFDDGESGDVRAVLPPQHRDRAHGGHVRVRRQLRHHRFRAALPALRAAVPPADGDPHRRAPVGAVPHPHQACGRACPPARWLRARCGQQPYAFRRRGRPLRLTTDAPVSYIVTEGAFILSRPTTLILHGDEPLADSIPGSAANSMTRPRNLADLVAPAQRALRMAGGGDPRRHHPATMLVRGNRRHRRGAHHLVARGAGRPAQLGLPLSAGSATPFSRCTR